MPAHEEFLVGREDVDIEIREWRFQQRRPASLQHHGALLRKIMRQGARAIAAGKGKIGRPVAPRQEPGAAAKASRLPAWARTARRLGADIFDSPAWCLTAR